MDYDRFLNKSIPPSENEILTGLGPAKELWISINDSIQQKYDFTSEYIFFTKKFGWSIRYRQSSKTMCYLFPETNAFSILIVLGGDEAKRVGLIKDSLNEKVKQIFDNNKQFHDGRWMWIRVKELSDLMSFLQLLAAKKKPK